MNRFPVRAREQSIMAAPETLYLAGYASRFDKVDLSGDVVRIGAFSASLLSRDMPVPMLYQHDTETPIGVWDRVVEDEVGLYVEGRLILDNELARRTAKLIKAGSLLGLSIGFKTQRAKANEQGRELLDIELWEVSIVAFPMLPSARLTEISQQDDVISTPTSRN